MNYTKHRIWRNRDLNEKFFEVLFQRESLKYIPGSSVTLYNGPDIPIFIASGIGEPWVRLILNRDLFPDFDHNALSIKLNLEIPNPLPSLMAEKNPNFILTSEGISPFFSYVSTFPQVKCKVCYLGDNKITEDWVKISHNMIPDVSKMRKVNNLYILGDHEVLGVEAKKLIASLKPSPEKLLLL